MTLNDLSSEQQEFVHLALSGKNVLCDACIGSGKTSTINVLCDAYPPERRILYLTYNRLLKLDAKDKIKNGNVLVQNYHGFASLLLNKNGIRNCGQGEQLAMVLEKKIPIPPIDTLIIDEYQDINDEIAELLKYIRSQNPGLQIVAVGDMKQKIYDDTALDVWEFMQDFLGRHEQVVFTKCFRISHDLAERLGNIWGKTINGVNGSCIVEQMSVDEVTEFLNKQNPKDVLCLGARIGAMTKVLNDLENRPGNLYDKHHVYASIADNDGDKAVAPSSDVGIFTTFDGSKGMDVFYSGFTNNEAEHYAIALRDELLRENRVKRGTQYARFAFFRTANRLNQYYKTATGQRVAKRVNNGDFPYNVYDANGGIVKPETKKTKKAG